MDDVIAFLKEDIKKYESAERYAHSLMVYDECMWYAEKLSLSDGERRTLGISALLHDITKDMSDNDARALCRECGVEYTTLPTLHQDTAAPFIKKVYGNIPELCAPDVLSAVSKHTTGGDGMTLCDMLLYTADFTEPSRKYENCVKAREYIHSECEKIKKNDRLTSEKTAARAVALISKMTIDYLSAKGRHIDPRTSRTLSQMEELQKE
ncbi:MAG: HD domain-containing protein [Clostridia bacterium]|nr:HD domain-containing protein [Clostridia bacterium]